MKFDLNCPLLNYSGQAFTKPGSDESMTLKSILESACLNANPQKYDTGEKKMRIFGLLMKIHKSDRVDLTVEELVILKDLVGEQLTISAVGAVYSALENPVIDVVDRN